MASSAVLAIVLAAYSSYSSCRQYREDIARAKPALAKLLRRSIRRGSSTTTRSSSPRIPSAFEKLDRWTGHREGGFHVAFTSHSIPVSMAQTCDYAQQIQETCRLVAEGAGIDPERWASVYQSRSGRPDDPWLGPDILDHLKDLKQRAATQVLIHPIGFLSDHLEVLYDLDVEAQTLSEELGVEMVRSRTVGTHPRFRDDAAHAGGGEDRHGLADGPRVRRKIRSQP